MIYKKHINSRLIKSVPFHCEITKVNGESIYISKYAPIVQRMFELRIQGKGAPTIAKILNQEFDVPDKLRKGKFSQHLVQRILKDRATTGLLITRSNEEVKDYFPAAISEETYFQANDTKPFMTGVMTSEAGTTNVIKGVTHCASCHNGVLVKTSNSRFRYLKCVKSSQGCANSKSLQYPKILIPILDSLLSVNWITKALKDISRSKERILHHEQQVTELNRIVEKTTNLTTIEHLVERIEQHGIYITFFRSIEYGGHDTILDALDVSTKSGRVTLNLILNITFKKIIVNFDSEQITLASRIDDRIESKSASLESIKNPQVWELKGLSTLLLKSEENVKSNVLLTRLGLTS